MASVSKLGTLFSGVAAAAVMWGGLANADEITPYIGATSTDAFLSTQNGTASPVVTYDIAMPATACMGGSAACIEQFTVTGGYTGSNDVTWAQTTGSVNQVITWGTSNGNYSPVEADAQLGDVGYYPLDTTGNASQVNGGSILASTSSVSLGSNGTWDGTIPYIGVNSGTTSDGQTDSVYLYFSQPISGFAALFNYDPTYGDAPTISALANDGSLLGSDVITSVSGDPNGGAVYGFIYPTAAISYIQLTDAYAVMGNITVTYNESASTSTAVPEPVTLALLGSGLFGLGVIRRRSKSR